MILTTIGFVLAVGVSVLVNVWTDGWEWSVGVGIAVLIGCQVVAESVRRVMAAPGSEPRKKSIVNQAFGGVRDSEISGINRASTGYDAEVQQRFKDVHNSTIVGFGEGDRS
ncbi:hypothetical protein [Streptomonospora arabica]|uniref:Uncharacterized protein n=1 Tax=Streptomonospora arabica TaxID=412417 RepID=A0ABV9SND1_9ACTN